MFGQLLSKWHVLSELPTTMYLLAMHCYTDSNYVRMFFER